MLKKCGTIVRPNISLSATSKYPLDFQSHTEYVPPHPQNGSPYHRYSLFFLPHPNPSEEIDIPVVPNAERVGFDLRAFCSQYGFDASTGGAAHMWREVWDQSVSEIYNETLGELMFLYVVSLFKFNLPSRTS